MSPERKKEKERKYVESVKRLAIEILQDVGWFVPEIALAVNESEEFVREIIQKIEERKDVKMSEIPKILEAMNKNRSKALSGIGFEQFYIEDIISFELLEVIWYYLSDAAAELKVDFNSEKLDLEIYGEGQKR